MDIFVLIFVSRVSCFSPYHYNYEYYYGNEAQNYEAYYMAESIDPGADYSVGFGILSPIRKYVKRKSG